MLGVDLLNRIGPSSGTVMAGLLKTTTTTSKRKTSSALEASRLHISPDTRSTTGRSTSQCTCWTSSAQDRRALVYRIRLLIAPLCGPISLFLLSHLTVLHFQTLPRRINIVRSLIAKEVYKYVFRAGRAPQVRTHAMQISTTISATNALSKHSGIQRTHPSHR